MDDRGRLAQSVTRPAGSRSRPAAASRGWLSRAWRRTTLPLTHVRLPRFAGVSLCLSFVLAAGAYGAVKGGHIAEMTAAIKDAADGAANAAGMRIATVSLSGQRQVSREQIFAADRRDRPFLAAVPRCRGRPRQARGDPLGRRGDGAQVLSRPAADHDHRARAVRAVADQRQGPGHRGPTAPCSPT